MVDKKSANSDTAKLEFMLTSDKLSIEGKKNGFGNKEKNNRYAQDMIDVLKESGDISSDTARIAKDGVKYRNKIEHENTELPVSEEKSKSFQNAANKILDTIEEYKSEGKYTEV